MNAEKLNSWLQIGANIGILGGLVLVGFQLQQNSQILRAQMLSAESRAVIDQEMQIIGDEGARAWVSAMSDPAGVSAEHHRVMEAIYWSTLETWRHTEELASLGLVEVDPQPRVAEEAAWYFGNMYGRAWWAGRRDSTLLSEELKKIVDQAIETNPDLANELHERLTAEIRRLATADGTE